MTIKKLMLIGLPLVLFGCPTDDDKDETDPPLDTGPASIPVDTDTDLPPAIGFMVELTDAPNQIVFTITNGDEDYTFGYAQTEVIANGGDGWTGEDCAGGEPGTAFNFCHPAGMTGVTLTHVDTPAEIVEGSTMLLTVDSPASTTPDLTYKVTGATSGNCWVWGHDITYYAADACTAYVPSM